jgi:hypothetical protein
MAAAMIDMIVRRSIEMLAAIAGPVYLAAFCGDIGRR